MDSFCKGFSTLVQDSLQCCANAQTGPLSFAALCSFSVYHVSLQFQSLEVRKQLRSKARQNSEKQILVMKSPEESSILSEFLKQHADSYSFTRCSPPTSLCFICMGVGLPHLIDSKTLLLATQQLGEKKVKSALSLNMKRSEQ